MQRGDSNPWTQRVSGNVPDGNGEGHSGKVYGVSNEPRASSILLKKKEQVNLSNACCYHVSPGPLPQAHWPLVLSPHANCALLRSLPFLHTILQMRSPHIAAGTSFQPQHWLLLSPFPGGFSDPSTGSHYSTPAGCPRPPLLHWDYPEFCLCGSLV